MKQHHSIKNTLGLLAEAYSGIYNENQSFHPYDVGEGSNKYTKEELDQAQRESNAQLHRSSEDEEGAELSFAKRKNLVKRAIKALIQKVKQGTFEAQEAVDLANDPNYEIYVYLPNTLESLEDIDWMVDEGISNEHLISYLQGTLDEVDEDGYNGEDEEYNVNVFDNQDEEEGPVDSKILTLTTELFTRLFNLGYDGDQQKIDSVVDKMTNIASDYVGNEAAAAFEKAILDAIAYGGQNS